MKKYIYLVLVLLLQITASNGQDQLTLEEAIQTALENNHEIKIKQYDTQIKAKEVDPALVGKKPSIDLNASYELGWSNTRIETLPLGPGDNDPIKLNGISNDVIISPEINLLLLDGKASTFRLEQLGVVSELAELQLRQVIEQTVAEVSNAYIQMSRQQSLMKIIEESIILSKERLARTQRLSKYGGGGSIPELQIEVDIKTDSSTLRNLQLTHDNARRDLNRLMGKNLDYDFLTSSNMLIVGDLNLPELETSLRERNTLLKLGNKNVKLAALGIELSQAAYKPTLSGYANLNFVYLQDDANFLQSNRSYGPNIGIRFSYPLYDGGARKIKEQTALLTKEQSQMERENTEKELMKELHNAYATYRNTLEQLRIEQSNLEIFERNLENIQNQYNLGLASNTDVRSAQVNLNAALNRIKNYQYTIKQAEIGIYFLAGGLVE